MTWVPPLLVAIPLLAGVAIAGGDHVAPRRVLDVLAVCASGATCALGIVLLLETQHHDVVHWFGGWQPRSGVSIGIDFVADPFGAGLCALAGGVVLLALLYSWAFLAEAARLVDVLLLVACGAMCGFALSGDLFNLFVWLELAGVAGYALTGFEIRQLGPLQGAVNFAIVNTLGGYLVVVGIALVYARTGALNLAQIGSTLAGKRPDGLVVVAMTLIFCGFLCKAAIVPFHLWLADAYATAPAPVCAVLAGAMTDIGLFGVARVYWTVFDASFEPHRYVVGDLLLWLGIVSALLGAVMAFLQRHLKRMLAYSVICHIGIMLAGIGLMGTKGLAGAADMLLAHGLVTAGLFLATGIVFVWLESIDELRLYGRARGRRWLAAIWFGGALALAGPPYVGVFLGHSQIDDAAAALGRHWVQPLLWLAGSIASAALLRAGARIFLGWGTQADELLSEEPREKPPHARVALGPLGVVTGAAVVLGAVVSIVPGLGGRTEHGAERFRDRAAYAGRVLHAVPVPHLSRAPFALEHASLETLSYSIGATVLAFALAAFGLHRARLHGSAYALAARLLGPPVAGLKALQSGVIGDYVMWLTVGTAVIGGVWAIALR